MRSYALLLASAASAYPVAPRRALRINALRAAPEVSEQQSWMIDYMAKAHTARLEAVQRAKAEAAAEMEARIKELEAQIAAAPAPPAAPAPAAAAPAPAPAPPKLRGTSRDSALLAMRPRSPRSPLSAAWPSTRPTRAARATRSRRGGGPRSSRASSSLDVSPSPRRARPAPAMRRAGGGRRRGRRAAHSQHQVHRRPGASASELNRICGGAGAGLYTIVNVGTTVVAGRAERSGASPFHRRGAAGHRTTAPRVADAWRRLAAPWAARRNEGQSRIICLLGVTYEALEWRGAPGARVKTRPGADRARLPSPRGDSVLAPLGLNSRSCNWAQKPPTVQQLDPERSTNIRSC